MPTSKSPRKGSLQFWPRKRAAKFLPGSNWDAIPSNDKPMKGFIGYKAGMASALIKDSTDHSMTKGKNKVIPVTIIECPAMKILSARFYKNGKVATEILSSSLDKEMKRKIKFPKEYKKTLDSIKAEDFDDLRIIAYSQPKKAKLKKTPDVIELGLNGSMEEKLAFVKEKFDKEILVSEIFNNDQLIDTRGLTKGQGFSGPVKRFGIQLKFHKSEKGQRRPGSLGPWHPARVIFRVPMAGQLGMFSRIVYNNKIVQMGTADNTLKEVKNYGKINSEYIVVNGSIQGPAKRQLVLTQPLRATKKQLKKNYELVELR